MGYLHGQLDELMRYELEWGIILKVRIPKA